LLSFDSLLHLTIRYIFYVCLQEMNFSLATQLALRLNVDSICNFQCADLILLRKIIKAWLLFDAVKRIRSQMDFRRKFSWCYSFSDYPSNKLALRRIFVRKFGWCVFILRLSFDIKLALKWIFKENSVDSVSNLLLYKILSSYFHLW